MAGVLSWLLLLRLQVDLPLRPGARILVELAENRVACIRVERPVPEADHAFVAEIRRDLDLAFEPADHPVA
jgi:hypothetical protein